MKTIVPGKCGNFHASIVIYGDQYRVEDDNGNLMTLEGLYTYQGLNDLQAKLEAIKEAMTQAKINVSFDREKRV